MEMDIWSLKSALISLDNSSTCNEGFLKRSVWCSNEFITFLTEMQQTDSKRKGVKNYFIHWETRTHTTANGAYLLIRTLYGIKGTHSSLIQILI